MDNTKLARINELARQSKAEGLTSAERQEQALLAQRISGSGSAKPEGTAG